QRNRGADALLTDAITTAKGLHEVERNLDLLRMLGLTVIDDREELWPAADAAKLRARHLPDRAGHRLVALSPHSAEEIKDWPFDRFLEVIRRFAAQPKLTFVIFGGPEHAASSEEPSARSQTNLVSLAGRLTLDETAALLAQCDLVLTVDTGLMHLANALQRP